MASEYQWKTPAQLANFLEKNNPPKARGQLIKGNRACAIGWLCRISGVPDEKLGADTYIPPGVRAPDWLAGDHGVTRAITMKNDTQAGWGPVIRLLRKLRPDGSLKRGKELWQD